MERQDAVRRRRTPCEESPQTSFLPQLAADESERRALVRGALATLPLRDGIRKDLESLLMYLDACAGDMGCRAYVSTLCKAIMLTRRTMFRRLGVARRHGLIATAPSERGASKYNRVQWDRLRGLAYHAAPAPDESQPTFSPPASGPADSSAGALRPDSSGESRNRDSSQPGDDIFGERENDERDSAGPINAVLYGTTQCQSGTTQCQSGTRLNLTLLDSDSTPPSPPPATAELVDDWSEVRVVVAEILTDWRKPLRQARANGLTAADALALVAEWERLRPTARWNDPPAVLHYKLRTAHPAAIPRPKPVTATEAVRADKPKVSPEVAARCVELLDAMDADERMALAQRALSEVMLRNYRVDPTSGLARMMMLGFLEETHANEVESAPHGQ